MPTFPSFHHHILTAPSSLKVHPFLSPFRVARPPSTSAVCLACRKFALSVGSLGTCKW